MILSRDYGTKVFIRLLTKQQTKSIIEKTFQYEGKRTGQIGARKSSKKRGSMFPVLSSKKRCLWHVTTLCDPGSFLFRFGGRRPFISHSGRKTKGLQKHASVDIKEKLFSQNLGGGGGGQSSKLGYEIQEILNRKKEI